MLVDGDAFYTVDIVSMYRAISTKAGGSFCFRDTQPKPIYSYVTVGSDGKQITSIKEKVKISDWANTGCYCFRDGQQLLKYCAQIIERGETQLSQDMKGEFYTSGVIKAMLDDGERFEALVLDKEAMHVLGTPAQLKDFCRSWPKPTAYRVCFDLDNTLFGPPEVSGDYSTCRPIPRAVRMCRHLKTMGHHIILHTARRMRTHGANVGAVVADVGAVTIQSLQDAGIEYDELHFGKPWAQFYIDDCGVNAYADLEKELGYYPPTSAAVASKYVPSPVASTPPSVVGRARHSSTTVALAAALGVAVGVLAARK
jgi:capsule biosynthesis phosphatase